MTKLGKWWHAFMHHSYCNPVVYVQATASDGVVWSALRCKTCSKLGRLKRHARFPVPRDEDFKEVDDAQVR